MVHARHGGHYYGHEYRGLNAHAWPGLGSLHCWIYGICTHPPEGAAWPSVGRPSGWQRTSPSRLLEPPTQWTLEKRRLIPGCMSAVTSGGAPVRGACVSSRRHLTLYYLIDDDRVERDALVPEGRGQPDALRHGHDGWDGHDHELGPLLIAEQIPCLGHALLIGGERDRGAFVLGRKYMMIGTPVHVLGQRLDLFVLRVEK